VPRISFVFGAKSDLQLWAQWISQFTQSELPAGNDPWRTQFQFEKITPIHIDVLKQMKSLDQVSVDVLVTGVHVGDDVKLLEAAEISTLQAATHTDIPDRQLLNGVGTLVDVTNIWSLAQQIRLTARQRYWAMQTQQRKPSAVISIDHLGAAFAGIVQDVSDGFQVVDTDDHGNRVARRNIAYGNVQIDFMRFAGFFRSCAVIYQDNGGF